MTRSVKKVAVSVLAVMLAGLAGCSGGSGGSGGSATATAKDTVTIATASMVVTLDPGQRQNIVDLYILNNVYDSLTSRDPDGTVKPMVAESWVVAKDGLSITAKIRQGMKFHNGEPVTAEDVQYSIMRFFDPKFPTEGRGDFESLKSVDVLDPYTVRFNLSAIDPLFMSNAATRSPIVPKAYASSMSFEEFGAKGMGSGPYKIVSFQRDQELVLKANDVYWQGKPKIKNVIFKAIPDPSSRTAALLSGELNLASGFEVEQIAALAGNETIEVRQAQTLTRMRLVMNANIKPFNDVRVREAVNLAIDTKGIIDNVLKGTATRSAGFAIPIEHGYQKEEPYPYDPAKAKQLLADAGYPNGFSVDFPARSDYVKSDEVVQAIASDLAKVGIKTKIKLEERPDFAKAQEAGQLVLGYTGFGGGGTFETSFGLISVWNCWTNDKAQAGYYCNDKNKKIFDEAGRLALTKGLEPMYEAYKAIQQDGHDNFAEGELWVQNSIAGADKNLDWTPRPDELLWMFDASWK